MKKMIAIWVFIAFVLFSALLTIGIFNAKKLEKYRTLEGNLIEAAQGYLEISEINLDGDKSITITEDDLKKHDILPNMKLKDDTCTGTIKVKKKLGKIEYTPHIICDNYETID